MNPTIHLSFRYTERDYVRALRAHYAMRLRWRTDLVVIIVALGAGVYFGRLPGLHWLGLACLAGAGLLSLLLVAAFTIIPPLAFRREPKFRDEYAITFSSEGIHFRTAHIDSQLQWSVYSRALVDVHSWVLYYGSHQFSVIPRSAFKSVEQQQTFEALLAQHVSPIVKRGA